MAINRVFLIVLDSYGIGYAEDASLFGDEGSNTLKSIIASKEYDCPNLEKLGLFNIDKIDYKQGIENPIGCYARAKEQSMGKDTTIGHWEIAGIISKEPMPTYPNGFPDYILEEFEKRTGKKCICSSTEILIRILVKGLMN